MMKGRIGGLAAVAAGVALVASAAQAANWPTFRYSDAHTGSNKSEKTLNASNVASLTNAWNAPTGSWIFNAQNDSFAEHRDVLFGSGSDFASIVALNTSDGSVKWQTDIVDAQHNSINLSPPAVASGVVYAAANYAVQINGSVGALYALSEKTGTPLWSAISLCNQVIQSPPTVGGGLVYFGDGFGALTAVNASTGGQAWAINVFTGDLTCDGHEGQVASAPIYASNKTLGNVVYVGADDRTHGVGSFSAYSAATGSLLWQTPMAPVVNTGALGQGKVFVNSDDGTVYALNDTTGAVLWSFSTAGGRGLTSAPAYANGVVYVSDDGNNLYALNAKNGNVIWQENGVAISDTDPTVANGVLYVEGNDEVKALDASNGNVLFAQGFTCNEFVGAAVVVNGALYDVGGNQCGGANLLSKFTLP